MIYDDGGPTRSAYAHSCTCQLFVSIIKPLSLVIYLTALLEMRGLPAETDESLVSVAFDR